MRNSVAACNWYRSLICWMHSSSVTTNRYCSHREEAQTFFVCFFLLLVYDTSRSSIQIALLILVSCYLAGFPLVPLRLEDVLLDGIVGFASCSHSVLEGVDFTVGNEGRWPPDVKHHLPNFLVILLVVIGSYLAHFSLVLKRCIG